MRKRRARAGNVWIAIFSIASCAYSLDVSAQTWRCGNAYSDRPCEGGKTVKVDDNRSDQDRRAADAGTRSARTQADQLERSRLSQEKAAHDRDRQAAREARSAAMAERRLALAEQKSREHASKAAREPRKSSLSFSSSNSAPGADAPERKKKKKKPKSAGSDAG